ncbi:MAG: macro domain-containing protein, partial [Nitrosopumilus sp.]
NCVGVMGKGIALEYKLRYPDMFDNYFKLCERKLLKPGLLQLWTKSNPWILNFPTKFHWKYPSKLEYVELGLEKFHNIYLEKKISSIAFPLLGVSSGGLEQNSVVDLMYKYFKPLKNIEIEIYHFDPEAEDNLFDILYQKIHRFNIIDFKNYINIPTAQTKKIIDAIESKTIHTMLDLQNVDGIGEKTLVKIYDFLNSSDQRIRTSKEVQLSLL